MKKVFVVDDDQDILTCVEIALQLDRYNVASSTEWQEIDATIKNFQPDLILLDVNLHLADGRDICQKIKAIEEWKHIPILLFSARQELKRDYYKCDANGFISKPFELNDLLKTIKSHIL